MGARLFLSRVLTGNSVAYAELYMILANVLRR